MSFHLFEIVKCADSTDRHDRVRIHGSGDHGRPRPPYMGYGRLGDVL